MRNNEDIGRIASDNSLTNNKWKLSRIYGILSVFVVLVTVAVCIVIIKPYLGYSPMTNVVRRSTEDGSTSNLHKSSIGPLRYRSKRSVHYKPKSHHNSSVAGHARSVPSNASAIPFMVLKDPREYSYNSIRLPGDLIPLEYGVDLSLNLDKSDYSGVVQVKLDCEKPTNKIVFHGRNITITNITIFASRNKIEYQRISYIVEYELFVVELEETLEEDMIYDVQIEFDGIYSKKLGGLYKSYYTDNGVKKTMVSTHFEPTDARSAFPCLDEPFYKSIFRISVTHAKKFTALSNMPVERVEEMDHNTTQTTVFAPTLKMSTYLVALTLNEYAFYETATSRNVTIRVYGRHDDKNRLEYSAKTAAKVLDFYEKSLNKTYPFPKCDLLAAPNFQAGAMEDWGLITFRSSLLVFDHEYSTVEYMKTGALVIAHELAHQWFGNLVTMKWWNDIWLNEGFASFFELLAINEIYKEYLTFELQKASGWSKAMSADSMVHSHPLTGNTVATNFEVSELFDTVTYNKGASILHMMYKALGHRFQMGLQKYLNEFEYGNAVTNDLWASLEEVTDDMEIKDVMDTWVRQQNFPIVSIRRVSNSAFEISQESIVVALQRMKTEYLKKNASLSNQSDNSSTTSGMNGSAKNESLWYIPLTYITDENQTETLVWFNTKEMVLNFTTDINWIKVNLGAQGFYLVKYEADLWKALINLLKYNKEHLKPVDRANLIHDSYRLACHRLIDPFIALNMSQYLKYEMEYLPLNMFRAQAECLSEHMKDISLKRNYSKYIWEVQSHLVVPEMIEDRWNASSLSVENRLQRMETLMYALKHNDSKEMKNEVENIFNKLYNNESTARSAPVNTNSLKDVSPENRLLALMFGFNPNKTEHYDFVWELYQSSPMDTDRRILSKSISQFKTKINVTLARALNTSLVRIQDTGTMLAQLSRAGFGKEIWEFLMDHYDEFLERYGHSHDLSKLVIDFAGGFSTESQLEKVRKFLDNHPLDGDRKQSLTEKIALEKINTNIFNTRLTSSSIEQDVQEKMKAWINAELTKETLSHRSIITLRG